MRPANARFPPIADAWSMKHICKMRLRFLALSTVICLSLADGAFAQQATEEIPTRRYTYGVSPVEAERIIGILQELQRGLRAGEPLAFELLSGSIASFPMTGVSPRQAFLEIRFETASNFQRVEIDGPIISQQSYSLVVAPNGPHGWIWDIDVVVDREVEQVRMVYRAAPPATPPPPAPPAQPRDQ